MERETGVEPATSTLARSHSTTELLPLDASHYIESSGPEANPLLATVALRFLGQCGVCVSRDLVAHFPKRLKKNVVHALFQDLDRHAAGANDARANDALRQFEMV